MDNETIEASVAVACPQCRAAADAPCRGITGNERSPHTDRVFAFLRD